MNILIIGASSGIGEELALLYAQKKPFANLILVARRLERLKQVREKCISIQRDALMGKQEPGIIKVQEVDITKDLTMFYHWIKSHYSSIHLLILNAGVISCSTVEELSLMNTQQQNQVIETVVQTNLIAPIQITTNLLSLVRKVQGTITVVSSSAAYFGVPTRSVYAASKAGVNGFFESLRIEEAKNNIHVCLICPGRVDTELRQNKVDPATVSRLETGSSLSPIECATIIYKSSERKSKQVLIPSSYWFLRWLQLLFPSIVEFLIKRKYGF